MANAEIKDVLPVDKDKFFQVVTQYEKYPEFVEGVSEVTVERKGTGKARVNYRLSIMGQDVKYTLELTEDPGAGTVSWELVESNFFKKNSGGWDIQPAGDGKSNVRYYLDVEFKIPVPGFIMSRLVKGNLPSMMKNFEKRAKKA